MVDALLLPDVTRCKPASQGIRVKEDASSGGLCPLVEQFQTDVTHAGLTQSRQPLDTGLSRAVEQGVAAAQIRAQRMFHTAAVTESHRVLLAGATTVGVIVPLGEESAEQTVLHVKQGHVLMQGHLQAR